ncbi:MAG: hypothetical protein KGQ77_10880, partial [Betaproteobacteria bacterium]|nr:hypothetical protein [Betaproteobacteria bacterium]
MSWRDGFVPPGRVRPAPESFLTPTQIADVSAGRRGFLSNALKAAVGGAALAAGGRAAAQAAVPAEGDPAILQP